MDFTIALLSSRWSQNIYGTFNSESLRPRENAPTLEVVTDVGSFEEKKPTWVFGSGLINLFVLHHVSVRFLLRSSVRGNPDDLAIADV